MTTVTREDVAEALAEAGLFDFNVIRKDGKREWDLALVAADALIAAFPHLVGEVFERPSQIEFDAVKGKVRLSKIRERTIYTVTGPWRKVG